MTGDCDRRTFLTQAGGTMAALSLLPTLAMAAPVPQDGPMEVAVIGLGRQGRKIIGELQKLEAVSVTAICDTDPSRLSSGQRRTAGAEAFATHAELLEKKPRIGAVVVATPTHRHKDIALDALAAGKHVFCEAPMAATIEDCTAMAAAARAATGVLFQVGLQGRSNPVYKLARSFFRAGAARELVTMRAQYHRKTSWRTPARDPGRERELNWRLDPEVSLGLAGEFGTQQFDVLHWFTGTYPTTVSGSGGVLFYDDGRTVADTIACSLAFPGGQVLQYNATLGNSFEGQHEVLYGTDAAIKLGWTHGWMFKEADAPTQGWEVYANRQQFHNDEGITLIADATKLASQGKLKDGVGLPNPPLYYALNDFVTSIVNEESVACSADEGMRATAIGILANTAIVTGATQTIDEALLKG